MGALFLVYCFASSNGALSLVAGVILPLLMLELEKRQKMMASLLLPQRSNRELIPALQC
jgi:hypothetical protein